MEAVNQSVHEASPVERMSFRKISQILIEAGLVTRDQVEKAILQQGTGKRRDLGELLIDLGYITESQFLMALADKLHRKFVDLEKISSDNNALAAIPKEIAYELKIYPVEDQGTHLVVATSDPMAFETEHALRSHINREISFVLSTSKQIADALDAGYLGKQTTQQITDLIGKMSEEAHGADTQEKGISDDINESDSRIVSLVNKILADAYTKRASDIHFDPGVRGGAICDSIPCGRRLSFGPFPPGSV